MLVLDNPMNWADKARAPAAQRPGSPLACLQSAGNAGDMYTPRAMTQFMVNPKLGERMTDG